MRETPRRLIDDLARQLKLTRSRHAGQGRAVFLVGAGCSVSAGIPAGADVAKLCAVHLAHHYSHDDATSQAAFDLASTDGEGALQWMLDNGFVAKESLGAGALDWGGLYTYFFDEHLRSINAQRDIIAEAVGRGGDRLNWAHACLGELVERRYVHTVLTTNFDQLVLLGVIRAGTLPVVADGLESLARVSAEPRHPQVVHLHGSMHTYNPRNSRNATTETRDDLILGSMLASVLQSCDLLVVVGYGGREEGVMTLLTEACRRLPPTQVFWVLRGGDQLSPDAQVLMDIGENKFVVVVDDADTFFRDIMNELHLGQPRWIADPVGALVRQRDGIVVPAGDVELEAALAEYRRRIDFAEANPAPEASELARTASLRLRKGFDELLANLAGMDVETADAEVLRMRGLTRLNIAQERDDVPSARKAVADFEELVKRTSGPRLELSYLQLFEAEMRAYELTGDLAFLESLLSYASNAPVLFPDDAGAEDWIRLHMLRAQAMQALGEAKRSIAGLVEAAAEYRLIVARATLAGNALLIDSARSELANVLQVFGEFQGDAGSLGESLDLQRQLAALGSTADPLTRAGRLQNLAGGCRAMAKLVPDQRTPLLQEARAHMQEAIDTYEREGGDAGENLEAARKVMREVEEELAA